MTRTWKHLLGCAAVLASFQAAAQIRLYEHDSFRGRSFTADGPLGDFTRAGFNDRASSVIVSGGRWVLCDNARFAGNCVRLRPGRYPSLSAMGLNDRVSSVRPDDGSYGGGGYGAGAGYGPGSGYGAGGGYGGGSGYGAGGSYGDRDGYRDRDGHRDRDRDRDRDGYRDRDRGGSRDNDGRYRDRDGSWRDRDGRIIGGDGRVIGGDNRVIGGDNRDRRRDDRNDRDRPRNERRETPGLTPIEREVNRDIERRQRNPDPSP